MLAKRWRLAFLGVALVLWTSIAAVTPVCADDAQAVVHYAAPAGYHAMWGKYGENGTLYMPYHFIIDYAHHKLYDLPCDLVIGPYEGLPDTYDLGIRYEREAAVSLRIYPGDNITLIGHFTDAQGNDLEQPYLEVVYGVPISPGGWPTPTATTSSIGT